jgi:Flp pilus assembly protein TadG
MVTGVIATGAPKRRPTLRRLTSVAIAALTAATLAGCSSGSDGSGSGKGPVAVKVAVKDGKVEPPTHRVDVKVGQKVRLTVTSDQDDELHIHGVDIEKPLHAGRPLTVEFAENQSGVFEVETHESNLQLVQLEVR